jgi:hypothetical protein
LRHRGWILKVSLASESRGQKVEKKKEKPGNNVQIRDYRDGDEEGMNSLYNTVFEKNRSIDGWMLKFKPNKGSDSFIASIAEADGKIVGMYQSFIAHFRMGDGEMLLGLPVEISIHPDYRNPALIYQLKKRAVVLGKEAGLHMGIGFPTSNHTRVGLGYLGYGRLDEFPILIRNFRCMKISRNLPLNKAAENVINSLFSLYRRLKYSIRKWCYSPSISVKEVFRFGEPFNNLFKEIGRSYNFIRIRDSNYLNWKYFGNPDEKFKVFSAMKENHLQGYIALTVREENQARTGYIYDSISVDNENVVKALLWQGLSYLQTKRVSCVKCGVLKDTLLYRQLKEAGFRNSDMKHDIVYEILNENIKKEAVKNINNWYLMLSETDWLGW